MTSDDQGRDPCREVSELLPWYVNGTISEDERQRVDAHLIHCANCRHDLAQDRLVYRGMNTDAAVEYMPAASLKRMQSRLDAVEAAAPANVPSEKPDRRPMHWQGLLVASIAVMAVAISLLAANQWMQFRARTLAPTYHTVTSPLPRAQGEVIRAVFSPAITLVEVQAILDSAGLRIVSGPTEAGVYSLATNSRRSVSASLEILRSNAKIRFAESIQSTVGTDDTP
ncbi:MAG TPA: zf-HC2 domain-containing protein [Steroidobacteraceae bacterium]|jgi:anti-sigma factor RsiW|nr:zf-HC2 domain-containing protein [Steroidobacteraceae bacterium]